MDQIREAVLNGSVAAGERLNEVRLSRTLAVSRTPVRAAFRDNARMRVLRGTVTAVNLMGSCRFPQIKRRWAIVPSSR